MKAKLDQIPIKRTPKTKTTAEFSDVMNHYLNTNPILKAKSQCRNRQWNADPRNKVLRNIRQRLRRYKLKLDTQLTTIWISRGLIQSQGFLNK